MRFGELHRIEFAEQVTEAYSGFKSASAVEDGLTEWAGAHPQLYEFAIWVLKLIHDDTD